MNMPFSLPFVAPPSITTARLAQTLMVIDAAVANAEHFIHATLDQADVLILDPKQDGIMQISEALLVRQGVHHLYIIAHGEPGCVYLGNTELSVDTLDLYALHLMTWLLPNAPLSSMPVIALYSGNVAAGIKGQQFLQYLQLLTGSAIAAATRPLGAANLGGMADLDVFFTAFHRGITAPTNLAPPPLLPNLTTAIATYPNSLL